LEYARAAMIRARRSEFVPEYQVGDLVKVSTRVLPLRCSSTQHAKLQPKYIGPFTIKEKLLAGAYRLDCLIIIVQSMMLSTVLTFGLGYTMRIDFSNVNFLM
jgi:hypothetical protein